MEKENIDEVIRAILNSNVDNFNPKHSKMVDHFVLTSVITFLYYMSKNSGAFSPSERITKFMDEWQTGLLSKVESDMQSKQDTIIKYHEFREEDIPSLIAHEVTRWEKISTQFKTQIVDLINTLAKN